MDCSGSTHDLEHLADQIEERQERKLTITDTTFSCCCAATQLSLIFCIEDIGGFAVDIVDKILERLGTTESTTLALKREVGGKIRVTSLLWEAPK
jgi:hypothetical protein